MSQSKKFILGAGDVVLLYISLFIALTVRYRTLDVGDSFGNHLGPFSLVFLLWVLIFYLTDGYTVKNLRNRNAILYQTARAILLATGLSMVLFYLFGQAFLNLTPRITLIIFSIVFAGLEFWWRSFLASRFAAENLPILIIGGSSLTTETIKYLKENPQAGYRVAEWIKNLQGHGVSEIKQMLQEKQISLLVIDPHLNKQNPKFAYQLLLLEVPIQTFWDFYEMIFEKVPLEELEESWFVGNIRVRRAFYDFIKRLLDILISCIGLMVLSPLIILIGLLIKISSRGPVMYRQERAGKNNRPFTLYKFRTMDHAASGPLWTETNDRRITWIGRVLRFTHLDESLQLLNVLRGDISFVGPRPERVELADKYGAIPYYEIRHTIKPGLTGWAQVRYKPSASLEEALEKLRYDIFYIKNRSLLLDLAIILRTIKYIFTSHS